MGKSDDTDSRVKVTFEDHGPLAKASGSTVAAVADPSAAKQTIEFWAEKKGFLPQILPSSDPSRRPAATLTVGPAAVLGLPQKHNPNYWKFAAARAANAWPDLFEITEADFDAQIEEHTNLAHG
jgi:hypothetical protein